MSAPSTTTTCQRDPALEQRVIGRLVPRPLRWLAVMLAYAASTPVGGQGPVAPFSHWSAPGVITTEPAREVAERRRERFRQLRESPAPLGPGGNSVDGNPWGAGGRTLHSPRPAATPANEIQPALTETGRVHAGFESSGMPLQERAGSGAVNPTRTPAQTNNNK